MSLYIYIYVVVYVYIYTYMHIYINPEKVGSISHIPERKRIIYLSSEMSVVEAYQKSPTPI